MPRATPAASSIPPELVKTSTGRLVELRISPAAQRLLEAMKLRAKPGEPYVFGGSKPLPRYRIENARKRLLKEYGAPEQFTWHRLRRAYGTFSTNASGIFSSSVAG